jgi:hypothetical protein
MIVTIFGLKLQELFLPLCNPFLKRARDGFIRPLQGMLIPPLAGRPYPIVPRIGDKLLPLQAGPKTEIDMPSQLASNHQFC